MKIAKTANGKKNLKLSKKEWLNIGKQAGWNVKSQYEDDLAIADPETGSTNQEVEEDLENNVIEAYYKMNVILIDSQKHMEYGTLGKYSRHLLEWIVKDIQQVLSNVDQVREPLDNFISDYEQYRDNPTSQNAQEIYQSAKVLKNELRKLVNQPNMSELFNN